MQPRDDAFCGEICKEKWSEGVTIWFKDDSLTGI